MTNMDDIYFGDGLYDLESDGENFRWASECFYMHIFNKSIKNLKIKILSEVDGHVKMQLGQETIISPISKGLQTINVNFVNYSEKIKLTQPFFKPSDRYKTTDERKLSYRIYSVTLITDSNHQKTINTTDISFYNENIHKNILKDILSTNHHDNNISIKNVGLYGEMFINLNSSEKKGKLNLNVDQTSFYSHRSGWNYVLKNLVDFHSDQGVFFDGFLENAFCWRKNSNIKCNIIPYTRPWVGFLHNPPNMPLWFSDNNSYPQSILHDPYFQESLHTCKGLYVLSNYFKKFLNHYIPHIPIEVLYHPTEIVDLNFSYDKFIHNKNKKIVNIGWWLRRLNSIFLLNGKNYQKIRLMPNNKCKETILRLTEIEITVFDICLNEKQSNSVRYVDHLSNDEYDELLSENIVFLDLYDTSANNAVIECIARGTPLLINKHPATIEYLGSEYPFYFDTLDDAAEKLSDLDLIKKTHEYLKTYSGKDKILIETFKKDLINSNIYKSL